MRRDGVRVRSAPVPKLNHNQNHFLFSFFKYGKYFFFFFWGSNQMAQLGRNSKIGEKRHLRVGLQKMGSYGNWNWNRNRGWVLRAMFLHPTLTRVCIRSKETSVFRFYHLFMYGFSNLLMYFLIYIYILYPKNCLKNNNSNNNNIWKIKKKIWMRKGKVEHGGHRDANSNCLSFQLQRKVTPKQCNLQK